jgi:outer membrane protein OmpA-like peptidoglycan-associated protein
MIRYGIVALFIALTASGQETKFQGIIKGRSGPTMILENPDLGVITVMLTDETEVGQVQGVLKARSKEMSMASLIPGLAVQVEATRDDQSQLVAKKVKFKGDDLKRAQAIQAGLHETRSQAQQNTAEIQRSNQEIEKSKEELEKQRASLQAQSEALKKQQSQMATQQEKIAANKAMIDAAAARFGQLDDYYILDEVTVYFANGKVDLEDKYKPQLQQLAQKAKTISGYMIEIKGYASSSGSTALNQKLSDDRAENVAAFLLQDCNIPSINMLAPAAMGESRQIGNGKTAEDEAKNRRVVVRILQNKGIVGPTGGEL